MPLATSDLVAVVVTISLFRCAGVRNVPKRKVRLICYSCHQTNTIEVDVDDQPDGADTLNMRLQTKEVTCPNPECGKTNTVDV